MSEPTIITQDGEVIESAPLALVDTAALSAVVRAEIDTQIATARKYPRSIKTAVNNILTLTTMDEETAAEAIYALPRGGKPIKGPSVRLAETIAQSWGNCRVDARIVMVDRTEKVVVAEGLFHDLETNTATRATVRRRIVDSKGRLFSDDMIIVTGNAACSIAKRNAILGGVPKAVWRKAYDAAESVVAGDVTTLNVTRDKAVKAFAVWGVKPEQVFAAIGVKGLDDISLEHIPTLRGMFASIKNGETTVDETFNFKAAADPNFKPIENPLADKAPEPKADAPAPPPPPPEPPTDPVEVAYDQGVAARKRGVSIKSIPADLKAAGREVEADAWREGWETADKAERGER